MGLLDQVKSVAGNENVKNQVMNAVGSAAKDENIVNQVKSAAAGAAAKVAGDKVDKKTVTDTVNNLVDQAAGFVNSKQDEKKQ